MATERPSPVPIPAGFLAQPAHWLALGFGTGCAKFAPGTAGSLAGLALWCAMPALPLSLYIICILTMFGLGVVWCGKTAKDLAVHDHPAIVWDEIVGIFITLTNVPLDWQWLVGGFAVFRLFDIVKPWPIRVVDQRVHGGWGIMLDDAIAGVFGWCVMQLVVLKY